MALIACPNCKMEISSKAEACPYCDHTLPEASLSRDIKLVRKVGVWLATLVGIPYLLNAKLGWLEWLVQGSTARDIWDISLLTAPLIIAISALVYISLRGWIENVYLFAMAAAAILTVTAYGSSFLAVGFNSNILHEIFTDMPKLLEQKYDIDVASFTGMVAASLYLLYKYLGLYGLWNFVSALLIGTYAGWVLDKDIHTRFLKSL